jgi:acyl carrier protein
MLSKFFNKPRKNQATENERLFALYSLIRNVLGEEGENIKLTPYTVLEEIGFDSIKYIHLLLSLEDIIDANLEEIISEIDLASLRTIADVASMMDKFPQK